MRTRPRPVTSISWPLRRPSFSITVPMLSSGTSTTSFSMGSQRTPSMVLNSTSGLDTWNS